jgi:hypothetical protein
MMVVKDHRRRRGVSLFTTFPFLKVLTIHRYHMNILLGDFGA